MPSMTLGCGSWGGNVTSDNISPIHLMDIKRIAFETKPVQGSKPKVQNLPVSNPIPQAPKRQEIASIVDSFLKKKLTELPKSETIPQPEITQPDSPVKTIIHELKTDSINNRKPQTVDFVSEDDVRQAMQKGEKIYTHAKTIITPSAKDLGEEKEIFAKI
jgi:acetaldehyde dehydrogenase (acetylating)